MGLCRYISIAIYVRNGQPDKMLFLAIKENTRILCEDWGSGTGLPSCPLSWLAPKKRRLRSTNFLPHAPRLRQQQTQLLLSRSFQPAVGLNRVSSHANDPVVTIERLDLNDVALVGHATVGGELTHFLGLGRTSRTVKTVFMSSRAALYRQWHGGIRCTVLRFRVELKILDHTSCIVRSARISSILFGVGRTV